MPKPIAVLVSDLHFSHNPPAARSAEPDWYMAMKRQWDQVREVAEDDNLPIVIAGDIFDQWRSPPELINFVIGLFQDMDIYAIPGQHDLPNHVYMDMHRSAYGTLVASGVLNNIDVGSNVYMPAGKRLSLWGFPWGTEITPIKNPPDARPDVLYLAVAHRYVWTTEKTCYPGAPDEQNLAGLRKQLEGYDAAVFGDNHKSFTAKSGGCNVLNCGGFMPRKSDERNYEPRFGLLNSDGGIDIVYLDTSKDKWVDPEDVNELIDEPMNLIGLIGELESLGGDALNFVEILERYLEKEKVDDGVKKLVIQALEKGREDEA